MMEQINAMIRIKNRNGPEGSFNDEEKPGYLYDIQGVKVFLHEDVYKPGTYTATEYYTGRSLAAKKTTMQEALDDVNKRIFEKGFEEVMKQVKLTADKEGFCNKPDHCLWCGK